MLRNVLASAAVLLAVVCCARGGDVVLYDPANPVIKVAAIDQPILNAVLANTGDMNTVIGGVAAPVVINAFVDTGASSSMISYLQATGVYAVPSLGFTASDYEGNYTETGIGGKETGKVLRPLDLFVLNGTSSSAYSALLSDFVGYGVHNLWVRQAEGPGEAMTIEGLGDLLETGTGDFVMATPVNIVGMPIIRQRVMEMDFTPLANVDYSTGLSFDLTALLSGDTSALASMSDTDLASLAGANSMATRLLPAGSPELHPTNITLDLYLKNFVGAPPPGETLPTSTQNPIVRHVGVGCDSNGVMLRVTGNEWLFDTGAGSSFISFKRAQELGLIPATDGNLAEFMSTYGGSKVPVGGVGASVEVPIMRVDEIRIPAKEGFDLVWKNVDVLVLDVPSDPSDPNSQSLDGVFGMNLLVPSASVDVEVDPTLMNLPDVTGLNLDDLDAMIAYYEQLGELLASLESLMTGLSQYSPRFFDYAAFDATNPDNVELRLYSEAVPEPASLALLVLGGLLLLRRRGRHFPRPGRFNDPGTPDR